MDDYTYSAFFTGAEYVKAEQNKAYSFGIGDFSVTMVFSACKPGISCFNKNPDKDTVCGWYIELKSDNTIYFYTGDGEKFCAVQSHIIPELFEGYIFCLATIRQNGKLSIFLDQDEWTATKSSVDGPCNVTADADLVFGGCAGGMHKDNFGGMLQNVTLWNRAISGADLDLTFNDIIFEDDTSIVGWWNFNFNLWDQSCIRNSISYSDNLAFVPFLDINTSEGSSGFVYHSITMDSPYGGAWNVPENEARRVPMAEENGLKRNIYFEVNENGALIGSCNKQSNAVAFPNGVEVTLTSPDGESVIDMPCNDDNLIVLDEGRLFQFLIINPKHGKWTLSVSAPENVNFLFDCQFIPQGVGREEFIRTINAVYPDEESNPGNEKSEYFLFSSLSRIIIKQLDEQKKEKQILKNDRRESRALIVLAPLALVKLTTVIIAAAIALYPVVEWMFDGSKKTIVTREGDDNQYNNPVCDWINAARCISDKFEYTSDLLSLYNDIASVFNCITPTDPKNFYKQKDFDRIKCKYVHIDLGGEGRFTYGNMVSGFKNALNINKQRYNSQFKDLQIPFLIPVIDWEDNFVIPFEDGTVDRITAQGIEPFTEKERDEIARTIKKVSGSSVDVWTFEDSIGSFGLNAIAELIKQKYRLPKRYAVIVENKAEDKEFDYSFIDGYYKYSLKIIDAGGEL